MILTEHATGSVAEAQVSNPADVVQENKILMGLTKEELSTIRQASKEEQIYYSTHGRRAGKGGRGLASPRGEICTKKTCGLIGSAFTWRKILLFFLHTGEARPCPPPSIP